MIYRENQKGRSGLAGNINAKKVNWLVDTLCRTELVGKDLKLDEQLNNTLI